ncbi:MAG: RagB/SusD family nutrient uptake outer membrane protein [Bacteroidales bacterium]|jgi:hypothetical protein|nr:RagB/SusD family nutrient uptake outer membrane protein [Bacteroidales bacterium]MCI2146212.1 RagB/SusD family nutrient uptake outer membrane protein [Bacteroidales bacterium]
MKKTILIITACALLFVSCDDFLNEQPQSDLTRRSTDTTELASAYSSLADAQAELNGAYALFKTDIYELENYMVGDVMSDNCYVGGDGVNEEQFDDLAVTAKNSLVEVMWSEYYSLIGSATNVVENVKLMDDSIDDTSKNKIIAEAKFIRAWAYFDVVRLWGAAPMTLELLPSITVDNIDEYYPIMYPARTSAEDIYAQILSDLDDSTIAMLDSKSNGAFEATQGAAYGLKAKVYATMGEKSDRDYQKVVDYCDKVIAQGYKLVDNFDDLWTVDGKFSTESIFELYFTNDSEQHNWAYWVLLSDVSGSIEVTWRRYCTPTQDVIAKFDKANDVRYASTIYWTQVPYDTYYSADNYPLAYKIRQKDNDIILLRLADILLLKAEALVELNEPESAIKIVNEIRTRAHVSTLDESMGTDDARLAVENERQLELLLEGQRWYDLVRNDRMEAVMLTAHDKNGDLRFSKIDSFRRFLPIPQDQIDINERLTQNEGY